MTTANLGLATTLELLVELEARFEVSAMANEFGARTALTRTITLRDLTPKLLLDYKTVGAK